MAKYRKKPVIIDAVRWVKNNPDVELGHFEREIDVACDKCHILKCEHGWVKTLEGGHIVCPGDWIITGIKGEKYPCKPDIFDATYEKVEE